MDDATRTFDHLRPRPNGQWGVLRFVDGQRVVRIHAQRNPDKLARLAAALGAA